MVIYRTTIKRGRTFQRAFTLKSDPTTAIPLTGMTFSCDFKHSDKDDNPIARCVGAVVDEPNGKFSITLLDTKPLPTSGIVLGDVKVKFSDNTTQDLVRIEAHIDNSTTE